MSVWFDKSKGRWAIRIRRGGQDLRKTLPKGTTEREANQVHNDYMRQVVVQRPRVEALRADWLVGADEIRQWEAAVAEARQAPSWLHSMSARARRVHTARGWRGDVLTFDTLADLALASRGRCSVTGARLAIPTGKSQAPLQASLDRIDCQRGYVTGNVRLVALAVNIAMNRWGEETFRRICYGFVMREVF